MANTRQVVAIALDADRTVYNIEHYHRIMNVLSKMHSVQASKLARAYRIRRKHNADMTSYHADLAKFIALLREDLSDLIQDDEVCTDRDERVLFATTIKEIAPDFMRELLIASNAALFAELTHLAMLADEVIIAIGSNRQSLGLDNQGANDNGTGRYFVDIQCIVDHLQTFFPNKKISLFKGVVIDAFNNAHAGDCYDAGLQGVDKENENTYLFDVTKVTMHFYLTNSILQYCRQAYPASETVIQYYFIDDLAGLCDGANQLFTAYPALLPRGVRYCGVKYEAGRFTYDEQTVAGTGSNNENLAAALQVLAKLVLSVHPNDQTELIFDEYMRQVPVFLREKQRQHSSLFFRSGANLSTLSISVVAPESIKRKLVQFDCDDVAQDTKRAFSNS